MYFFTHIPENNKRRMCMKLYISRAQSAKQSPNQNSVTTTKYHDDVAIEVIQTAKYNATLTKQIYDATIQVYQAWILVITNLWKESHKDCWRLCKPNSENLAVWGGYKTECTLELMWCLWWVFLFLPKLRRGRNRQLVGFFQRNPAQKHIIQKVLQLM